MIEFRKFASDCISPDLYSNALLGNHVILTGENITGESRARIDVASVIIDGRTIGQGTWVRAGSMVIKSVPAHVIVEGNPAQVTGYQRDTRAVHLSLSLLL